VSDPILEGLERPLPDHMGYFLNAFLNPPTQDGPPYVHTFQHPEPVPVLDDGGGPVLDETGEPVMRVPLLPTHTITRDPAILPRRCESEACDEYNGVHCYGDGCALARETD